ncbi:MAG: hypothetical protein RMA76_26675 [Deltaproteobacteria bacterium]
MVRTRYLALTLVLCGCEDGALIETVAQLDAAIHEARVRSRVLMQRRNALAAAPGAPKSIGAGGSGLVRARIVGMGSSDHVTVEEQPGQLSIVVRGERGRRQAAQALLAYGVDAPQLELQAVKLEEPAWSMKLSLARPADVATATISTTSIQVPEPSFFSFSEGEALHRRAEAKARELEQLNKIIVELEGRLAQQKASVAAAVDEATMTRFRARRYFAIALLPDVTKGQLTFAEDRATWKGATSYTTLDEAKAALSGRGEVIGFAPGERGSLEAKVGATDSP